MILQIQWNIDPIIFTFRMGGFEMPFTWYGLFFAMSFLIGIQVSTYLLKKEGKPQSDLDALSIYILLATVIGARLGHYLFYEWEYLLNSPLQWFLTMITPPFAGLASHGATIAILISIYLYARTRADQSFFWVVDRIVIGVSFAGLIRLGNLFNSEIYGKPTELPWGFVFLRETNPNLLPLVPRHPTQLYEFLFCMLLFAVTFMMWNYRRHILPNGVIAAVFIIGLFTFRFFVEFLKNEQVSFEQSMALNMGQLLSIPAVLFGILILVYAYRKKDKEPIHVLDTQA